MKLKIELPYAALFSLKVRAATQYIPTSDAAAAIATQTIKEWLDEKMKKVQGCGHYDIVKVSLTTAQGMSLLLFLDMDNEPYFLAYFSEAKSAIERHLASQFHQDRHARICA